MVEFEDWIIHPPTAWWGIRCKSCGASYEGDRPTQWRLAHALEAHGSDRTFAVDIEGPA